MGLPGTGAQDPVFPSARAYNRILKVCRTIADLEDAHNLMVRDVVEAVQYRGLDRRLWA